MSELKKPAHKTEKLKNTIKSPNLGGKRPGAGMKKGTKIKRTLEKEAALREYRERVMKHADELFTAQLTNAKGNTYIYRIEEDKDNKGNIRKKHILVTNPNEIIEVLDENQGQSGVVGDNYFIVTTEKPDNIAIKDMLDRTFGTATQSMELSGKDGEAIKTKTELTQIVIQSK